MTKTNFTITGPPKTEFHNNYLGDTLTSQRGPTLGDIQKSTDERPTSHLSFSSDEYKSSNNDIRLNSPNGGVSFPNSVDPLSTLSPPPVNNNNSSSNINLSVPSSSNGVKPTSNDYAVVNKKSRDTERQSKRRARGDGDDKERKERRHRSKSRDRSTAERNKSDEKKHRSGSEKRKQHSKRAYEEVGESSKSPQSAPNGDVSSNVNQSYSNEEYC